MDVEVKGLWYFEYPDRTEGPFENHITADGLALIAKAVADISSPYLVVDDDAWRKPVSLTTANKNKVRFRTQLNTDEHNGTWHKASIYLQATDLPGSGIKFNELVKEWTKDSTETMTVVCEVIFTQS